MMRGVKTNLEKTENREKEKKVLKKEKWGGRIRKWWGVSLDMGLPVLRIVDLLGGEISVWFLLLSSGLGGRKIYHNKIQR